MQTRDELLAALQAALKPHGLRLRGCWTAPSRKAALELPSLPHDATPAHLCMVGQVGSECWSAFSRSVFFADGLPDPMDRWSKSIGHPLAQRFGGRAVFPSDGPPYIPFQQWARLADPLLQPSPLMLQIHPDYGLWHAYRFALVLPDRSRDEESSVPTVAAAPAPPVEAAQGGSLGQAWPAELASTVSICATCDGQPCLRVCPVDAFTLGQPYAVDRCAEHLHGADLGNCMVQGCSARRACPVGAALRYGPSHAVFHMAAFASRH
ncbi:MAG: hypothetical protein ABI343_14755 [Burkholderiaceae bacterium]